MILTCSVRIINQSAGKEDCIYSINRNRYYKTGVSK